MLQGYTKGFGATAKVTHIPSISGVRRLRPTMVTILPFPFRRFSKVEAKIENIRNLETAKYMYQNGCYYDGVENRVGGFGIVELVQHEVLVRALMRRSRPRRPTSGQIRPWNAMESRRKLFSHPVPSIFLRGVHSQ